MAKLIVNVGGMFSGKTTELQRQGERHLLAGQNVVFLKPLMDNRYSVDEIVTHKGQRVPAINTDTDGRLIVPETVTSAVLLIDEVQFFDKEIVNTIISLVKYEDITVYCSGLDMDFMGKPFETTALLMAVADDVNKFQAVCEVCGADAIHTGKRNYKESEEVIELGAEDKYVPLCRKCYAEFMERETQEINEEKEGI